LRIVFANTFSLPTVLATSPQGASDAQKARFTEKAVGAFLRVIGVTPGYDIKYAQASAEGADVYTQAETNLKEAASIAIWGTVGLLAGGSGFANADLFEQMAADIISAAARHIAQRENEQIWCKVLKWANSAKHISKSATNAQIEYQTESAAVIERKAKAAKALMDAGYTPEEAQARAGIKKTAMLGDTKADSKASAPIFAYHIQGGIVTPNEVRHELGLPPVPWGTQPLQATGGEPVPMPGQAPEAREEDEPEPTYSEGIAAALNERGESVCPCANHADRHCPRCGVVRRKEVRDGEWIDAWHPTRRRAA
jgi:hypothetical protein